jgi:hypothetical protein
MSFIKTHGRLLLVAVCCAALGAGASIIASAGAATHSHPRSNTARTGLRGIARRAVHGVFTVHTKNGYRTVTLDRGTVDSVSGRQLKITEGTPKAAYKTVTLTVPSDARVRDDKQTATLSAVKPGQRVLIVTAPRRTTVIARTPRSH